MTTKSSIWINCVFAGFAGLFSACEERSNEAMGQGEVAFEITDAPIDDANVKSVMVTVADVRVDGKSISGFSKQTIDLKAYQDGETRLLGNVEMDSRAYSNLELVLDLNNDEQGNSPGCYVLDQDNTRHQLNSTTSGTMTIATSQSWKTINNAKTNVVIDFDLRKSIRYADDPEDRYSFVSGNNLNGAVRVVTKQSSGTISGTYQEEGSVSADMIIVHAYKKGTFNSSTETQPDGVDGIYFRNALSSAEVKSGLTGKHFTLAFLPEGEYELHFSAYSKNETSGKYAFEAMLESETSVDGSIGNLIKIESGVDINITTKITGII